MRSWIWSTPFHRLNSGIKARSTDPPAESQRPAVANAKVAVLYTRPDAVVQDIGRLMELADVASHLSKDAPTGLKVNVSWHKYFPACSSQPWQVEGVVKALIDYCFPRELLIPIENKTVVTDPVKGARNNRWLSVLQHYGLDFTPLPDLEWIIYKFKSPLLKLNEIFPEGIEIPKIYPGRQSYARCRT